MYNRIPGLLPDMKHSYSIICVRRGISKDSRFLREALRQFRYEPDAGENLVEVTRNFDVSPHIYAILFSVLNGENINFNVLGMK